MGYGKIPRVLLVSLLFVGCIKVKPYVPISKNDTFEPLSEMSLLDDENKRELDQYLRDNTFFDASIAMREQKQFYTWGNINIPYNLASVRKSIFSALYGIAAERNIVDLDASLADLGVDDNKNPLTATEKTATIRQLLQARSGIYIPAAGESSGMKRRRPKRGQYLPGEHFYYNNWDFNALPIILEQLTGMTLGHLIYEWLAVPTGMRNFQPENVTYQYVDYTEFPQTRVYMTAADLARFGSLYLNNGQWGGNQIIPADWIETSVQPVSQQPEDEDLLENELMEAYAYLWWVDKDNDTFWAEGSGGQFLIVDQTNNFLLVLRNNTGMSPASYILYQATERYEPNTDGNQVFILLNEILSK